MLHVVQIMVKALFETCVSAPAVNLCVTCEAASNHVANIVVSMFSPKFPREFGPLRARPDQAHVSPQNVPKLRELVKTIASEASTNRGATGITWYGPDGAEIALSILLHRSELDHCKAAAGQAYTGLAVEDRPAIGHAYHRSDQRENRREQNQGERRCDHINRSLDETRHA